MNSPHGLPSGEVVGEIKFPETESNRTNYMTKRIVIPADHGMAIAGLKPHAQCMEALRADPQGTSRLLADFHE
ncbi:MAG: hypothetical protein ACK40V_04095, partial [Anaerolineales bacterium]